jgi:hypothetical protein
MGVDEALSVIHDEEVMLGWARFNENDIARRELAIGQFQPGQFRLDQPSRD